MMNNIKYDSYYKFKVSLGIAFCILPFLFSYSLLLIFDKSFLKNKALLELAPFAQEVATDVIKMVQIFIKVSPVIYIICLANNR